MMQRMIEATTVFRYLAEATDTKDPYTLGHADRVARYAMKIHDQLPASADIDGFRDMLLAAALLHDVGKLRVPDAVLKKPGRLTDQERLEIELHPVHSLAILGDNDLRGWIGPAIRAHHEKLDGSGYPDGLKGDEISMAARIIAVADVFDACTSKRIYRKDTKAMSDEDAIAELRKMKGSAMDPDVVEALVAAYRRGDLLMARAASYADAINPAVTSTGGEERTPLAMARTIYERMLEPTEGLELTSNTRYRVALRLANHSNIQGDSVTALATLERAREFAVSDPDGISHDPQWMLMQEATALRALGQKSRAARLAAQALALGTGSDWLNVTGALLLGDIALDQGDIGEARRCVTLARAELSRLKRDLGQDCERSPFGVLVRWWNPERLGLLECRVALLDLNLSRRTGSMDTERLARATCENFDILNQPLEASMARCEQGRLYSARGDQERAIFILRRERKFANAMGDDLNLLRRTCWLAEAHSRCAASEANDTKAAENELEALRLLDELAERMKGPTRTPGREWQLAMGRAIVCWNIGRPVIVPTSPEDATVPRDASEADPDDNPVHDLLMRFFLRARDPETGGKDLLDLLADKATDFYPAIRTLEVAAEAAWRDRSLIPRISRGFGELFGRFGGSCWLDRHHRYSGVMSELRTGKGEVT